MPIRIDDLDDGLGKIVTGTGKITGEEFVGALTEHFSQPVEKLKKYIYSIVDFTEARNVTITLDDLHIIVAKTLENAKINPDMTVVIATNEVVSSLLAEMWQLLIDESGWDVNIFTNREELQQWLSEALSTKYTDCHLRFS